MGDPTLSKNGQILLVGCGDRTFDDIQQEFESDGLVYVDDLHFAQIAIRISAVMLVCVAAR